MTILDHIIQNKLKEVNAKKALFPISVLEKSKAFVRSPISLAAALNHSRTGIIAEHKRRSPSKSVINDQVNLPEVASGYKKAGVCGISVLTDTKYFGGSLDDLALARNCVDIPLLRKEFIIDPYQIYEARAYGADAILLIAAALSNNQLKQFSKTAKQLGLDVLLEVHNEEELQRSLLPTVDMLGVNNRNLKNFEVSIEVSKALSEKIPNDFIKISESGISDPQTMKTLQDYGYKGFLIGETFMKTDNPGESARNFIASL
ncbi:indole-3-glycerol phosphate synthase TrpC [Marixanthomonas spongiae]|uniref:Indole-3-glycerol phosphate synthase n=1 Tax=Marixanthomonas spongiae TaxID=2174845 RepID=A0A2U0I796_9FLAO|nr:indole-3-glycerol phosphate synthase TrpC [Marixanthomonas spongiae]PVW16971.1 indole-3-glycerol phosphate synthase TrpC [Marixanthomonas spongiae]